MSNALPYSQKFKDRVGSLYASMRSRAREIRDKNNRIIRQGYELKFTIDEFRRWFLDQLGGEEGCVTRCAYCNKPVDAYSCTIDHGDPLKRGGSPSLSNLAVSCPTGEPPSITFPNRSQTLSV